METWLTVVISIIGALGILGGALGVTAYLQEKAKAKAQSDIKEKESKKERTKIDIHEKHIEEMRNIFMEEFTPIKNDIADIKKEVELNRQATVTSLRAEMKQLRDQYKKQGYADAGDTAIWNELYESYRMNGGNHFKEYVNQWKEEVNSLPLDKPENHK